MAKNLFGGLVIGAALGMAAGILLAPRSGAKTRRKLVRDSMKLKDNVMCYIDDSVARLREQFNSRVDQLAKRGKETISTVSERVKV